VNKEIQISSKTITTIIVLVVILAIIAAVVLLDPQLFSDLFARIERTTSTPTSSEPPDAQAAVVAVKAFYSLDYAVTSNQWQSSVCKWATQDGCTFFEQMYASTVRALVESKQVQTGCTVVAVKMVEDDGASRIWQLQVTLDHPWEGETAQIPVYAQVDQVNGSWRLDHILFSQESARFQVTPTP